MDSRAWIAESSANSCTNRSADRTGRSTPATDGRAGRRKRETRSEFAFMVPFPLSLRQGADPGASGFRGRRGEPAARVGWSAGGLWLPVVCPVGTTPEWTHEGLGVVRENTKTATN